MEGKEDKTATAAWFFGGHLLLIFFPPSSFLPMPGFAVLLIPHRKDSLWTTP